MKGVGGGILLVELVYTSNVLAPPQSHFKGKVALEGYIGALSLKYVAENTVMLVHQMHLV